MKSTLRLLHLGLITSGMLMAGCLGNSSAPEPAMTANDNAKVESASDDLEMATSGGSVPFDDAEIYIEYNATAADAGIQVFFDADAWHRFGIRGAQGGPILDITAKGPMRELGLTELRYESDEPSLVEVLELFPAGPYDFFGTLVDGGGLHSTANLSHDIPAAPSFTPSQGELVDPENAEIAWASVAGVETYQVIVESDENPRVFTIDLSASTLSVEIPESFLESGIEYKVEVLAIAPSGNRTISEGTFVTMD